MSSLKRSNHWRKKGDKVLSLAPHTVHDVLKKKHGKAFSSQDCSADPCNCTGCDAW